MKRVSGFVAMALLAVVGSSALRAQSNPLVGTWKLNVTKSKYDPGPAPKSLTRIVEARGNGVKYSFDGVSADGQPIAYGFSVQFDGKDNPLSGSIPSGEDTIAATRTDSDHFVATLKKGGKVIGTSKVAVSKDGKVTTVDSTGFTATGAKTHDVQVFDKQ
jgi:cysteine synthase